MSVPARGRVRSPALSALATRVPVAVPCQSLSLVEPTTVSTRVERPPPPAKGGR
ncbi:hypothetical protein [Streptomyces sp. NPDC050287]|uniref:hypothetical protein n=1 Tax=Streptomyces sp. NPDC050287 TaxID=3365608 RepID=UPI0037BB90C6